MAFDFKKEYKEFYMPKIEHIDIYPEKPDNGCWIRNIVFNFPMPVQGQEIKSLPLESESIVDRSLLRRLLFVFIFVQNFCFFGVDNQVRGC